MSSQQINNSSLIRGRTLWARIYRFEKYLLAVVRDNLLEAFRACNLQPTESIFLYIERIYSRLMYRYNSNNRLIRLPYCITCYAQA
jgi:hypothetical protein